METMREQLLQISQEKKKKRDNLYNLRAKYIKTIYVDYLHKKTASQVASDLYDLTISNKKKAFDPIMYANAISTVKSIDKKLAGKNIIDYAKQTHSDYKSEIKDEDVALAILLFGLLEKARKKLGQNIITITNDEEAKKKKKKTTTIIDTNRHLETPKVFYLSSFHNDSAEDHKDYQNRIYYDKDFESVFRNTKLKDKDELIEKTKAYIRRNKLKSIQWVMDDPVWFITRPNCRHYFIDLDTREVLRQKIKRTIKNHEERLEEGNREYLQTLKSDDGRRKIVGEKRNAELMIEKYKLRYEEHKDLAEVIDNPLLKRAMKKDVMLIQKWSDYLKRF